jgi:hypothetical protein
MPHAYANCVLHAARPPKRISVRKSLIDPREAQHERYTPGAAYASLAICTHAPVCASARTRCAQRRTVSRVRVGSRAGKLASTPPARAGLAASAPSVDRSSFPEPGFDRLDDDVYAIVSGRRAGAALGLHGGGGGTGTPASAERGRAGVASKADGRLARTAPSGSSWLSASGGGSGGAGDRNGSGQGDARARTFRQELADMRARTRQLLEQAAECERLSTILAARIGDDEDYDVVRGAGGGGRSLSRSRFEEQLL